MSSTELLVIVIAILVLFGGKRLPEIARLWGRTVRELRRNLEQFKREAGLDFDFSQPDPPQAPKPRIDPHKAAELRDKNTTSSEHPDTDNQEKRVD